uniref:NACHT domain-containing protein n=1 Tax=Amphimedon queenslandica TaxID=400682 RepID=A0A1X7U0U7_AMPQE
MCLSLAIDIFNTRRPLLSQSLSDPVSVAIMLQREGVITGQVLASVESASPSVASQREVLLDAIIVAIHGKYSILQTFASVLCKFTGNVKLGTVIQRDYDKAFNNKNQVISDDEAQESSDSDSKKLTPTNVAPLYIPQYKSQDFDVLSAKFAKMFSSIRKVISKCPPPLEDLKTFIEDFNSDLEAELSAIKNLQGVMRLIRKNCSLINIVILEAVVEHFEIDDAQKYIDDYKREIDESCRNLSVDLCLNEPFDVVRASPPLKCETATYVLGWEATEHKLKDVTDIVSKSSGKFVKLVDIKSTHSITITCSFPHSLTGALIIKLSENLELLIKNGLMMLTVGYCTIWKKQKMQEIQEPLEEEIKEQPHDTKRHKELKETAQQLTNILSEKEKTVFPASANLFWLLASVDFSQIAMSTKSQVGTKQQSQKKSDVVKLPKKKGPHYPSWLFAHFCDELVSILIKDRDLLLHLTDSVTINLLKHPVDMKKIQRNSHSIIGCKMLANAVLEYLSKAKCPDYAICDLLLILESEGNVELTSLVNEIRKQAEKHSYNIKPKTNIQVFLSVAHASPKCIQNFRTSFQLPLDPKCSLMVVSEFIPLNKVTLKGENTIGQMSQLSIDELCNVPPSSWILIEGVSGIGKSTLAYEMLKQWKDGTALQNYSYVLLLRFRNENVHQYWSPSKTVFPALANLFWLLASVGFIMSSKSSKSQVRKKQQSQKKSDVAELPTAKGPHKPHYPSWLFAHFYDELVSILIKDCDLLLHLTNSVTINLLKHPVDMEKIQRNSISIIGCKMLANAILEYLSKARRPDYAICDLLLILEGEGNVELTSLVNKIREQAEKNSYNIQPKCNVQIFLSLVHVSQSSKCIENFRSSFQLPLDPKCSLMVALEFIPLDKVSLKGVSPIGQTSPLSINELCDVPPSSWILIEGISGIGKSTLAYEMLKQWKDGTALQKYSYVLLLRLRNENVHQYWSSSPNVSPNLERIVLSLNPIGNEGLAIFLSLPPSVLGTITEFFLRAASLKSNDCFKDCVTKFEHFHALKTFLFHDNEFKEGEQQQLIDVLCHGKLKNLKKVSFSSLSPRECSTLLSKSHLTQLELYELSHESVKELFTSLKTKCSKLISIELYQSPITKAIVERSLQDSLPDCILKELKLINCEIDSKTANLIINAATHSPTLQVIDLSDNIIDNEGGHYIASKLEELLVSRPRPSPRLQLAGETRELHNSAENILQLFLQHNFFTKKSIEEFTDKLTQLPYSFTIHLSLQWKDYVETKLSLSPQVEKLLVIDVQNDNLALKRKQQHHSTQPSIASLTCNDIPARHDERPDLVPSATDDTDEDDTESGWNKVKKKRRGRRHK